MCFVPTRGFWNVSVVVKNDCLKFGKFCFVQGYNHGVQNAGSGYFSTKLCQGCLNNNGL